MVGILFINFLNLELKYLILSIELVLGFEKSLIKVVVVRSSPNFNKNLSSNMSQFIIDPKRKETYQDPRDPSNVYGRSLKTQYYSVASFRLKANIKL